MDYSRTIHDFGAEGDEDAGRSQSGGDGKTVGCVVRDTVFGGRSSGWDCDVGEVCAVVCTGHSCRRRGLFE
jgi:hypothetical protein